MNSKNRIALLRAPWWWLFSRPNQPTRAIDVIQWWEVRRAPFNLIVGAVGVFTCAVSTAVAAIASAKLGDPIGLPDPPILAVLAVIAYGIGANICFTGGWFAELAAIAIWKKKARHFGPIAFSFGLVFSVVLTLAPAGVFSAALIVRLILR